MACSGEGDANGVFSQFIRDKILRQRLASVPVEENIDTAARPAGGNAEQPPSGCVGEVCREIRDYEEMVLFCDHTGLFIVFGDGPIFVAQIHLDDFFDVLVERAEPLLDLRGLGPNPAVDELFLVVGQVHHAGEVLAQAYGVYDAEIKPARRRD